MKRFEFRNCSKPVKSLVATLIGYSMESSGSGVNGMSVPVGSRRGIVEHVGCHTLRHSFTPTCSKRAMIFRIRVVISAPE